MVPLDFSGYVPGIVNNGPGFRQPTVIEICQGLEIQIRKLRAQLGDLTAEEFETFRSTVTASLETVSGELSALSASVDNISSLIALKEDVSDKVTVIDDTATNVQYPSALAVYTALESVYADLQDLAESIETKADANTDGAAVLAAAIPYGVCDSTSTSTRFTAQVPGITELKTGVCMLLKNGVVTSASGFTINVNGLGGKPAVSNMTSTTLETTIFNSAYTMLFIYDENRISGGCWICYRGYDANTNTIGYQLRTNNQTLPMKSVVYRYRLLFTSADGLGFVPATNSSSTNATSSRAVCQNPIDPFGQILYYNSTTTVSAGSRPGATSMWQQYVITLGYSFNVTNAALVLTTYAPVYVKATPQAGGGAIIDSTQPYTQTLPTSADGSIYIFLGIAHNTTNIELNINHPVYYHDGTAIRLWTGPAS